MVPGFRFDKYQELLRKAIGSRTQKKFAFDAGLSLYYLNHILNGNPSDRMIEKPRKSTLMKIARASEGRVSEAELLKICCYDVGLLADSTSVFGWDDSNMSKAMELKAIVSKGIEQPIRFASIASFLDNVLAFSSISAIRYTDVVKGDVENGAERNGAEKYAACTIKWINGKYDGKMMFVLFYCETSGGGVIVLDCAFDLISLLDLNYEPAKAFLEKNQGGDDVDLSRYDTVWMEQEHVPSSFELKLLSGLFGKTSKGD